MSQVSRREFMQWGAKLAAVMGLGSTAVPAIADAVAALSDGSAPVLWLQAQSCSGCSVSVLNSASPDPAEIITRYIALRFHPNLSAASGHLSMHVIRRTIEQGGYYLVVEGSIPTAMPQACVMDHEPMDKLIASAARNARAIIAQGTCAVYGGIPAAQNNPTGAVALGPFLKSQRIDKPMLALPGCPPHPDWLVGTLVHVLKFGLPKLDAEGRPLMFFADYERERFATSFSEDGCLFRLGCLGPITHADCTIRPWNGGTSNCIGAGSPCIGCASRDFATRTDFPFFRTKQELAKKPAKH